MWVNVESGSGQVKTAAANITGVTYQLVPGNLTVLAFTFDNVTATTPTVSSIPRGTGETAAWTLLAKVDSNQTSSAGATRTEIWGIVPTVALAFASQTVTLSASVTAKVWNYARFAGGNANLAGANLRHTIPATGSITNATTIATSISVLTGVSPNAGDLVLVAKGVEGATQPITDVNMVMGGSDTSTGWYSVNGTSGGGAAANAQGMLEWRTASPAGNITLDSWTGTDDKGICAVVLTAGPQPPVASFGATGTLSARKAEYVDIALSLSPLPAAYFQMNETPDATFVQGDSGKGANGPWPGKQAIDRSPYARPNARYSFAGSSPATTLTVGEIAHANLNLANPSLIDSPSGQAKSIRGSFDLNNSDYENEPSTNNLGIYLYDYIQDLAGGGTSFPSNSGLNVLTSCGFVKLASTPTGNIRLNYSSRNNWVFSIGSDLKLRADLLVLQGAIVGGTTVQVAVTGNTALTVGSVYHVALVYDGNDAILYVNGVQDGILNVPGNLQWYSSGAGYIVWGDNGSTLKFDGWLQEWGLWKAGLTPAQIAQLAGAWKLPAPRVDRKSEGTLMAVKPSYSAEVLASNPQFYYKFNEASGTVAADSSVNNVSGTYQNSPVLGQPSIVPNDNSGKAFRATNNQFDDGVAHGMVRAAPAFMGGGATQSLEFTFKANTIVGIVQTLLSGGYSKDSWMAYVYNSTSVRGGYPDNYISISEAYGSTDGTGNAIGPGNPVGFGAGNTYHCVLVRVGSVKKFYINGYLVISQDVSAPGFGVTAYTGPAAPFNVGFTTNINWGTPSSGPVDIDDVSAYNYELDLATIRRHYFAWKTAAPALGFTGTGSLGSTGTLTGSIPIPSPKQNVSRSATGTLTITPVSVGIVTGSRFDGNLSAEGTLAIPDGIPTPKQSVGLSSTGTLSGSGIIGTSAFSGSTSLSSTGTLALASVPTPIQSTSLSSTGTLSFSGILSTPKQSLSLTSTGTLVIGSVITGASGVLGLTSTGSLSATASPSFPSSLTLSGTGTLSTAAVIGISQTLNFSSTGTLGAVGGLVALGSLNLSSTGTLTGVGTPAIAQVVAFSSTGTLATASSPKPIQSISFNSAGTLTTSAAPSISQGVGLGATGTLTTASIFTALGSISLSSTGSLTSSALVTASGSINLSSTGSLTSTAIVAISRALSFSSTGTLSISSQSIFSSSLNFSSTGSLTQSAQLGFIAALTLSAAGNLTGIASPSLLQSVPLSSTGTLTTLGTPKLIRALALSSIGSLSASGQLSLAVSINLSASGTLQTATGELIIFASIDFSAAGNLNISGSGSSVSFWENNAEGTLTLGTGTLRVIDTANFDATGFLTAKGSSGLRGSADLSGEGLLVVVYPFTFVTASGAITLSGEGFLDSSSVFRAFGTVELSVDGALDISGSAQRFGAIDLSMIGDLQASAEAQARQTLDLLGVGILTTASTPRVAYPALFSTIGKLITRGITNIIYVQTGPISERLPGRIIRERPSLPWQEHFNTGPIRERPTPADVQEPSLLNQPIVERDI